MPARNAGPLLLPAYPRLRAAEHRNADVTPHDQLLAVLGELHRRAIRLSVLGVEDLAAAPFVAVRAHVAKDLHPDDRLTFPVVGAFLTHAVGGAGVDEDAPPHDLDIAGRFVESRHGGALVGQADHVGPGP